MQFLHVLGSNPLLNICFISWFLAQLIKTGVDWFANRSLRLERLTGSGGMPSSHSALVSSLAIGMARAEGFQSPVFALTLAFAAVVMYDAMHVRRAAGENTRALNQVIFNVNGFFEAIRQHELLDFDFDDSNDEDDDDGDSQQKTLKEYRGHTPLEVLAGALLGILIAMSYPLS
ncbi:MAG: divergent PAP2 family protein [Oscillospiraceae bacterium]